MMRNWLYAPKGGPAIVENGCPLENKNPSDPIKDVQIFQGQ